MPDFFSETTAYIFPMPDAHWHYLENQFDNCTRDSRKRMNVLVADFKAKIAARAGEHATFAAIHADFAAHATAWTTAYNGWRNKKAQYRGATQTLENLLEVLAFSGAGAARSKIDEWDSRLQAHWGANDPVYVALLPEGRAPFTTGGRDARIAEVDAFATRLGGQASVQNTAVTALQAQVDAIAGGGGTPPESLLDALEDAQERLATLQNMQGKVAAFSASLESARTTQQGIEGQVNAAVTAVEARRRTMAEELYGHLGTLMKHFRANPAAAGDFFDLTALMQSAPDEEPEPEPVPPTP